MLSLLALVLLAATLLAIFYAPLSLTTGSVVFAAVWLLCGLLAPWLYNPILLILVAAVLVILNHPGLRSKLIARPVFQALGKMMPPIGDTEREAIEAGARPVYSRVLVRALRASGLRKPRSSAAAR